MNLTVVNRWNGFTVLVMSAGGFVFFSAAVGLALAAGGILMAADVWWLNAIARRFVEGRRTSKILIAVGLAKFGLILGAIALAIGTLKLNPVAFGIGVGGVVAATSLSFSLGGRTLRTAG